MRYLLGMIVALGGALLVMRYVAPPVSAWVVGQSTFESPDGEASLDTALFLGLSFLGLLAGWVVGWGLGGALGLGQGRRPKK